MQHVEERVDLPGSARMVLVDNVVPFDPEPQIFEAMLEGWARQQRVRFLKKETIDRRLALVRRASRFSGQYPRLGPVGGGSAAAVLARGSPGVVGDRAPRSDVVPAHG